MGRVGVVVVTSRYSRVEGSPYQPGDAVVVTRCVDHYVLDLRHYVGWRGRVRRLDYEGGAGCPGDPMVGVALGDGEVVGFWPEELAPLPSWVGEIPLPLP